MGHCTYLLQASSPVEFNSGLDYDLDRLLMPTFGVMPVRDMFDDMLDIAEQLILKWERYVGSRGNVQFPLKPSSKVRTNTHNRSR